mmetsp:Transcript_145852/g.467461  ORF Transcript_145852/g.467461 Transcript_145852/m.467461 type:complete len:433 (-) Transcript_145852:930-2228(-)
MPISATRALGRSSRRPRAPVAPDRDVPADPDDDSDKDSDDSAQSKQSRLALQPDIFSNVVVMATTKHLCHQDTLRAIVMCLLVMAGQFIMAIALLRSGAEGLQEHELAIIEALRSSKSSKENVMSMALQQVCGGRHLQSVPVAHGLGWAIHDAIQFDAESESALSSLRYQLRGEFRCIFVVTTLFWIWRCFFELRNSLQLLDLFRICPTDCCNGINRKNGKALDLGSQVALLFIIVLRLILEAVLLIDGYFMNCETNCIMDLIMNAVALEFIFNVDDVAAIGLLSKRELEAMEPPPPPLHRESASPSVQKTRMSTSRWNICRPCRSPVRSWLKLFAVLLLTGMFSGARFFKVKSLHSRAFVACLTNGLTDGTSPLPDNAPEVVFPAPGFCASLVGAFSGLNGPNCWTWRNRLGEPLTNAICSNPGNIADAKW